MTSPIAADTLTLADSASAQIRVVVNGLDMSEAMWARVMAAVRGLFPNQTAGLSDSGAIQALMQHIVIEWVATWEGSQAAPDPSAAAKQAQDQAVASRLAAADQARSDATADIHVTVTT